MTPPAAAPLPIDLDAEAIQVEGHWYTRDELARKIKGMLDAGDFAIGKPSQALEQLTQTLATLRTIAFLVTPEMADAINAIGARYGRNVGSIIREALALHLGLPPPQEIERAAPRRTAPAGRRQTEPELPVVTAPPAPPPPAPSAPALLTPALPPDLKAAQPASQIIAGPGAHKAAQAAGGAASPSAPPPLPPASPAAAAAAPTVILDKSALAGTVEAASPEAPSAPAGLTPKKTDEDGIERRWFGG